MATPYKRKYPRKFSQLNDPDISDEQKIALTREFATKYPKDFNKALDKISPDPYRGTRKLADMLIQQYPDRFPGATPDDVVNVLQKIAKTESKDQNIAQMKGGPGRGYFQIETTTAPTALKRYQNYQDILAPLSAVPLPKIAPTPGKPVKIAGEKVPTANVMNLSKDQQAMLALSNIAANAKSKGIVDVANPMDTWLNYHWAGSPEQRPERAQHWVDTFQSGYGKGGKLTKKGKKIRKYGPRPDYMNQNPAGMKTGPIQQRSIGNTPGGGYMSFANGGNIPTWSPGMIGPPPMPMGFSPEQRERLGLYTEQGPNPYNLQYNVGEYTGVPAGMSQHYSGETGISNSPCGPGFAIDYDENGYEVCVPIGLKSSKAASPTAPSPIPSSGGSYQYYPELGYSTTPERYALVMRNRNNLASKPAEPQGASDEVIYSIERSRPETSFSFAGFPEKPSKEMAGEPEAKRKLRKGKSFHRGTGLSRFFSNVGEAVSRCLPGEDCPKMEHGGWVYPANTAFPSYAQGGSVTFSTGGEKHKVYIKESPTGMGKGVEGHVMVNHPTMDKGKWDTIDLTEKAGAKTVAQGVAATKKWHRENPEYGMGGWTGYPDHTMYSSAMGQFDKVRDYTKYKQGGVTWSIVEDRLMASNGMLTGYIAEPSTTRTNIPQQVQVLKAAKEFQSDLRNPRVTEEQFKSKHGISREQYRNKPSNFDVAMNQVWQGAKEPFKLIGADPDLIRENPSTGIPQALTGVLAAELPIQEMGMAAYNAGSNAVNAGKILAEEGLVQLGNYGINAPRNLIRDVRNYSKGINKLENEYLVGHPYTISPEKFKELESIRRASNHWKSSDVDEATRITKLLNSGLSEEQIAGIANAHPSYLEQRLERLKNPTPSPTAPANFDYNYNTISPEFRERIAQLANPPEYIDLNPRVFNLERPARSRRRSRTALPTDYYSEINPTTSLIERLNIKNNPEARFVSEKSIGDIMSKLYNKNIRLDFRPPKSIKGSFYRHSNQDVANELNELQQAINNTEKGQAIHGAYSVSDSSYPLFLSKLAQNTKSGKVIPTFSGDYRNLNEAGHLFRAGVSNEDITGYINKYITDLEKIAGKPLPKAKIENDQIMYPAFGAIKQKQGGKVTWQIID